jgi:macrolide-specific efflux system membrane fusion protein
MGHRDTLTEIDRLRILAPAKPAQAGHDSGAPAADAVVAAEVAPVVPDEHAATPLPAAAAKPVIRRYGWFIALTLLLAASGWYVAGRADPPNQFATATAEVGPIEDNVSATGTVQPLQFVDVGTQVTGQLRELHVQIGSMVKKGQLLAEVDPTVFQSKVETARASLRQLEAQLRDRQAQAQLAELLRDRNRRLKSADAVSEEILQQSEAAAVQARAQVDAVRAQIQQAQSSLQGDEANLRYTRIYAPMAGTVVSLNARQGQTLVSSQQAPVILRIADLSTMTVWAQVSEADVPRIAVGMPVYFNTLGLPQRRWTSKVRQVLPTPDAVNNVVLYNVLFEVGNGDGALKPQMSTQVFFRVAGAENALTIPEAALQSAGKATKDKAKAGGETLSKDKASGQARPRDKAYFVGVLRDGKVEERPITVGLKTRMLAQVTSGLQAGEEVVVGAPVASKPKAGKDKSSGAARSN